MKRRAKSRKSSMSLFEQLENRQLMSVSPFVINGTSGNDVIVASFGTNLLFAQNATVQSTTQSTTTTPVTKVTPTTALTTRTGVGAAAPVTTAIVNTPVTTVQTTPAPSGATMATTVSSPERDAPSCSGQWR